MQENKQKTKIMMIKITLQNLKKCPRFSGCSINACPLDLEANLRSKLPEEESCPFTIKKRAVSQKGIRILAPDSILEVIPESNVKMLHKRNQKRWYEFKKDGKK